MNNKHPIQPTEIDEQGVLRFKENAIVSFLLNQGPFDMNDIARSSFSNEDREQFAQLIGYSVSGSGDLHYMSETTYRTVEIMVTGKDEKDALIECLEGTLSRIRMAMRRLIPEIFRIHPDDLVE